MVAAVGGGGGGGGDGGFLVFLGASDTDLADARDFRGRWFLCGLDNCVFLPSEHGART